MSRHLSRPEILAFLAPKQQERIDGFPPPKPPFTVDQVPASQGREIILAAIEAEHRREPIKTALNFTTRGVGCWTPLWLDHLGIDRLTTVEPLPLLAAEIRRRYADRPQMEVIQGDLPDADALLGDRTFDLGFTSSVLQHVPPEDIARFAAILRRRCRRLIALEMVRATDSVAFSDKNFEHDYAALFGSPQSAVRIDPNRLLMVWRPA